MNERDQTRKAHDPADAAVVGSEKVCRPKMRFELQDEFFFHLGKKRKNWKNRVKKKLKIGRFQFGYFLHLWGLSMTTQNAKLETVSFISKSFREQKGH